MSIFISQNAYTASLPPVHDITRLIPRSQDPFFAPIDQFARIQPGNTDYDFAGIISLSNCSGSIIQFKGSDNIKRPALILTNGHCIALGSHTIFDLYSVPGFGEVIQNYKINREIEIFDSNAAPIGIVSTTKIVYATMTYTDIAIYELEYSYEEIEVLFDIRPLMLSDTQPMVGEPIDVISGFWRFGYSCNIDADIPQLREDVWTWQDAIRYSQPGCETIGGTSGSPVVSENTREVIAINNTGNENGETCTIQNPCEVDTDGNLVARQGASYGQQTYLIYSCLDSYFNLSLDQDGCLLPK
jgi:V8-like Glu-specific endopeptidase